MTSYIPRKGDLVTVSFDPQSGHEQRGRRPALVVSNGLFNRHTGLCVVCPITSTRRQIPFHVELPSAAAVTGFIMVEQIKSVDFRSRQMRRAGEAPPAVLDEVLALLDAVIY